MSDAFFRIEMLPARHGDALLVEYGRGATTRRILIDGGPIAAYPQIIDRLRALPEGERGLELVVVSHVDTDHIEGLIRLFAERRSRWPIEPADIWFNGWRHMEESLDLGGREGDFLSALLRRRAFDEWNKAFDRKAVVVAPHEPLPEVVLEDGMTITLLSPDAARLKSMAGKWEKDVQKFGLDPGDLDAAWDQLVKATRYHPEEGLLGGPDEFIATLQKQLRPDTSKANGTSIAFLAAFEGRSVLFLADAHTRIVCDSIKRLIPTGEKRLKVDAFKMSHHGSRANISKELLSLVDAEHYLVSTNGDIHDHPDQAALEAVVQWSVRKPTLWFNYRNEHTTPWENAAGAAGREYDTRYPGDGEEGILLELRCS
jgi:hypothetical protein